MNDHLIPAATEGVYHNRFSFFAICNGLLQIDPLFLEKSDEQTAENKTDRTLNCIGRYIDCDSDKSIIYDSLKEEVSADHEYLGNRSACDPCDELARLFSEELHTVIGDECHRALDRKGCRGVNEIAREHVCKRRADSCGKESVSR